MQHFVLHSMARLAVGVVIGCGVLVSNGVRADTVFKDTEVRAADAKPEAKPGILSSVVGATFSTTPSAFCCRAVRWK
jgi:hypothetical protein